MMAEFVRYELLESLLVAIATLGFERVCALYRWPRRFLWAAAMIAALMFPLSMALTTKPDQATRIAASFSPTWIPVLGPAVPPTALPQKIGASPDVPVMTVQTLDSPKQHSAPMQFSLDGALKLAWLALSIACIAYYGFIWLRLRRRIALAAPQELDGIRVRVTDKLGPAAFGLFCPEILMPQWILDAPPSIRSVALEHERQHIAAGDPTLLFSGIVAVALMPWNVVLWWMLRRLRFCLEADCDARVVKITGDARTYAEALIAVCQHHAFTPSRSVVLTSSVSWLERRVRIMVLGTSQLSRALAASGSVCALGLLVAAILLQAPGLAARGELRKLPPDDTKPGTALVRSIARARFPELFDPSFEGMAQVIIVLNRDGSVVQAREKIFTPDKLPRIGLSRIAEAADLALDVSDMLYGDVVDMTPPNQEGSDRALGYIEYAVLKWPHDPMRSEARVRSAVEAYFPELKTMPDVRDRSICVHQIAVLMNDDGSIRQAHAADTPCPRNDEVFSVSLSPEEENRLNDFDVPEKELGRGGFLGFGGPRQPVRVRYTWPRHVDDAPDVIELSQGQVNASIWQQHQPRQDTRDDSAIMDRYFPEIVAHGNADLFRTIDGRRYRLAPWILFWTRRESLANGSYALPNYQC